jgi:hypothetical protein
MAGIVMQVVPKRTLDFNALNSGSTEDLVVAQGIDISQWRESSLMMRLHVSSVSAGGTISIFAQVEGRTAEDPGILFFTSGQTLGLLTINSSLGAPYYTVNGLGSNVGAMIRVVARGNRTGAGTLNADVSVDLSLKSA